MKRLLAVGVFLSSLAALLAAGLVAPSQAATNGLAYDSVTRFKIGSEGVNPQPGTFDADFEQASQPRKSSGGGGMFGKMKAAMEAASGMFQTGIAQRHYIAGSRERTDDLAAQKATITDCSARTITTLDLAKKTYSVESMDKPLPTPGPEKAEKPGPAPTDDGTKFSMVVTTTALGPKKIGPDPTNGYNLDVKMTTTKPTGESQTSDMSMTSYYSNYANPHTTCTNRAGAGPAASGPGAGAMATYGAVMRGLVGGGKDARFKVSASGPPIPAGKLSLFDVFAPKAQGGEGAGPSGGFGMVMERGNVRAVTDADPAFGIPAGFTKEP